jgi:hypothetical protein
LFALVTGTVAGADAVLEAVAEEAGVVVEVAVGVLLLLALDTVGFETVLLTAIEAAGWAGVALDFVTVTFF